MTLSKSFHPKKISLILVFIALFVTIVILCVGIFYRNELFSFKKDSESNSTSNYWYQEHWEQSISSMGPNGAYQELKQVFSKAEYLPTHQALHAFGFALYKKFGSNGIKYCDDYQRYGCFHGVLAAFVSDKGIEAAKQTGTLCPLNQPSSENKCFHGIGHGLVDYLGKYNLNLALKYCKDVGSLTYLGCPQGAIMEYFAPINKASNKVGVERFDETQLFKPCSTLDQEYQKYCYFFVPGMYWPNEVLFDPIRAESYCQQLEDSINQQMCVVGIGVNLSNKSNFDLLKSQEICLKMNELKNKIYCTAGVRWNSGSRESNKIIANNMCMQLGTNADYECREIAKTLNN